MSFEPGLTVVVGPNGSGKSNISDAILWVLGEQSAKQLRGQAMEDVIFSGSSARQPVGVAEVTLVLDNTDHVLPVDFSEVALTRRMYRSGESEYLINGSPCRLMDIQDILHDSGLGKDTHSIISQGKLDSILQSRPEERRSLIEEAAGISKHKRRKERALRKIKSMDEHLVRARDINREISRQLKPLERQVDRARKYKELSGRANELTTILAVDELRRLQQQWGAIEASAREAAAALELAHYRSEEKERELEKLQVMLEEKGLFVGDLGEQRRRMQDTVGRINSDMRLLEEKGRNMVARLSEMRGTLSGSEHQRRRVAEELEQINRELNEVSAQFELASSQLKEAEPKANVLAAQRRMLDSQIADLTREMRSSQHEADDASLQLVKVKETLSNAELEDEMFASRLEQIEDSLEAAQVQLDSRRDRAQELEDALDAAHVRAEDAKSAIDVASRALDVARNNDKESREHLGQVRAELAGLQKLDAMSSASDLEEHLATVCAGDILGRVGDVLEAPCELEHLVEELLSADVSALVVPDASALSHVGNLALQACDKGGSALVIPQTIEATSASVGAAGYRLVEKLSVKEGFVSTVNALLGHIYVVDSLDEALAAPIVDGVVYVTPEGARVSQGGMVRIGRGSCAATGVLERKRRIRELEDVLPELEVVFEQAERAVETATAGLAAAREASANVAGEIARTQGEHRSLLAEIGRLEQNVTKALSEQAQVTRRRQQAGACVREAQPKVDELTVTRDDAQAHVRELAVEIEELTDESEAVRRDEASAAARLSEVKVAYAQAKERMHSLERRAPELKRRLEGLDRRIKATTESSASLEILRLRVDPLYERYEALVERATLWAARLRDQASLEEADSDSLKKTIEAAKAEVNAAHKALEEARQDQASVNVERGKLEVQVENAIKAITRDGSVVLEEALQLPAPQDRDKTKAELERIVRQINNLGPVNQVAMEEYEALKQRADYISSQLEDLESARKSLTKITSAIDRKMKRQFLVTFEAVDKNFQEVFAMLFPGGNAHLEMTDPDHPADTGIEVVAQPRGKRVTKMTLMSGGERSLTALALLFAVYRTRTVPFYVLDEVEAALDDSNLSKLIGAINVLRETTQLIVVSHQRRTMEEADVLYGVSMQADGVSRVISQKLDHATGKVVNA